MKIITNLLIFSLIFMASAEAVVVKVIGHGKYNTGGVEYLGIQTDYHLPLEMNDQGVVTGNKVLHIPQDPYNAYVPGDRGGGISVVKYRSYKVQKLGALWNFGGANYRKLKPFNGTIHMNNQDTLLVENKLGKNSLIKNREIIAFFPDGNSKQIDPMSENDSICFIDDEDNVFFKNEEEGIYYSQNINNGSIKEHPAEEIEELLGYYEGRFKGNQEIDISTVKELAGPSLPGWEIQKVVLTNTSGQVVVLALKKKEYRSYYVFIDLTPTQSESQKKDSSEEEESLS